MIAWTEGNVQANDITIHYYCTGDKNNPSVLLLHGITDRGRCWSRLATELAGSFDVTMTDARGHGHSSTSATEVSIALLAEDAVAVIRALGLQKPFLIGHSMGAVTAATVAANYPDVVRAIVLEDPPLFVKPLSQADINRGLVGTNEEQAAPLGWQWLFELRALPREERIARGYALNPSWVQEEIIPWADSKAEMNTEFLEPAHAAVVASHGAKSSPVFNVPFCSLRAILIWERLSHPKQGGVVHIAGAGHNIRRDRYAEMMGAIEAFLNKV